MFRASFLICTVHRGLHLFESFKGDSGSQSTNDRSASLNLLATLALTVHIIAGLAASGKPKIRRNTNMATKKLKQPKKLEPTKPLRRR
jgi:hypothetical protein